MALHLSSMCVTLHRVRKDLETLDLRKGLNDQQSTLARIGRGLFEYNMQRNSIKSQHTAFKRQAVSYLVLFVLFMTVPVTMIGLKIMKLIAKDDECMNGEKVTLYDKLEAESGSLWYMKKFLYYSSAVCLIIYGVLVSVKVFSTYHATIYNKIYNIEEFENSPTIKKLINLFNIAGMDDSSVKCFSSNSAVVAAYLESTTIMQRWFVQKPDGDGKFKDEHEITIKDKKSDQKRVNIERRFMVSQDGSLAFDFVALKKELDSFDVYSQLARVRGATEYFSNLLLKKNDDAYSQSVNGLSSESRQRLLTLVAEILQAKFVKINHVSLKNVTGTKSSSTQSQVPSMTDCFEQMISFSDINGAQFVQNNNQCNLTSDISTLVYTPNAVTFVKYVTPGSLIKIEGKTNPEQLSTFPLSSLTCDAVGGCFALENAKFYTVGNQPLDRLFSPSGTSNGVYTQSISALSNSADDAQVFKSSKDAYVKLVLEMIVANDPSHKFELTVADSNFIMNILRGFYGSKMMLYEVTVNDILNEVSKQIIIEYNKQAENLDSSEAYLKKYIPYERFYEKLTSLNTRSFVLDFIFQCNEISMASRGLYNLYMSYDTTQEKHDMGIDILEKTFIFAVVIAILMFTALGMELYDRIVCNPRQQETEENIAKRTNNGSDDHNDDHNEESHDKDDKIADTKSEGILPFLSPTKELSEDERNKILEGFKKQLGSSKPNLSDMAKYITSILQNDELIDQAVDIVVTHVSNESNNSIDQKKVKDLADNFQTSFSKLNPFTSAGLLIRLPKLLNSLQKKGPKLFEIFNKQLNLSTFMKGGVPAEEDSPSKQEKTCPKTSTEKKCSSTSESWLDYSIAMLFLAACNIIPLFALKAYQEQKRSVFDFNKSIFTNNGDIVVTNSEFIMSTIYEDCLNNTYTFVNPNAIPYIDDFLMNEFWSKNITINRNKSFKAINDIPDIIIRRKEFFDAIVASSTINSNVKAELQGEHRMKIIYSRLIEIIESVDKCNNLFMQKSMDLPLPILNITVWVTAFLLAFIVAIILVAKFRPIYTLLETREQSIKLSQHARGIPVNYRDLERLIADSGTEKTQDLTRVPIIKIVICLLIIAFIIFFCILYQQNINDFRTGLMSSELFKNKQCYDL